MKFSPTSRWRIYEDNQNSFGVKYESRKNITERLNG